MIDRVSYYISSVEYGSNFKARSFQSSRWLAKTRRKSFTKNELNRLVVSLAVDFVSVTDSKYCKNLFRDQNKTVLRNAERIYGEELLHSDSLPHLICAPCERRLNNAIKFKSVIEETQRVLQENVRAKRCVDVSPSVPKPPTKVRSAGTSRRRSIDFNIGTGEYESSVIPSPLLNVSSFESDIYMLTIVNFLFNVEYLAL